MAIILKNIWKSYDEKPVLRDFSCTFPDQCWTLVTGASGCGKTTLLRLLLGLEKADRGRIDGTPERFSVVFQENRLCEGYTVLDNLRIVEDTWNLSAAEEALKELELYECRVQKVSELSGGMKRRTAILRAVLVQADIYLLDEPFYGLDQKIKMKTLEFLMHRLKEKTVILITHDQEVVNYLKEHRVVRSEVKMDDSIIDKQ